MFREKHSFELYRYQIIPIERNQLDLFQISEKSIEELLINKNAYFIEAFNNLCSNSYLDEMEGVKKILFKRNLISILSTLLAINIAVLSIILTRMAVRDPSMANFANSKNEIWKSINEQVILIAAALVLSIFSSKQSYSIYPELIWHTISVLFITVFIYAIWILRDTAKALIDIH